MVLFVFLPIALAAVIVPLVSWMHRNTPRPVLTSEILEHGVPGEAEILSVRNLGTIVDLRPMVRFELPRQGRLGRGTVCFAGRPVAAQAARS